MPQLEKELLIEGPDRLAELPAGPNYDALPNEELEDFIDDTVKRLTGNLDAELEQLLQEEILAAKAAIDKHNEV